MKRIGATGAYDTVRRRAETESRKARFGKGRHRVKLIRWAPSNIVDENQTVPPGTFGWTNTVDDLGTVWIEWDNGVHLGATTEDVLEEVG